MCLNKEGGAVAAFFLWRWRDRIVYKENKNKSLYKIFAVFSEQGNGKDFDLGMLVEKNE
ncbi:hypothetical protein QFZ73_003186 [Peribacillus sp. V2I11]|nr:hypothetical protein [Peribacillus sp. V2I11]